jgi:tetratricopeptide (TPR) repeat protein
MTETAKVFEQLCHLGYSQFQQGNDEDAIKTFEKAVALARILGDQDGEATVLTNLGTLCYSNGEFDRSLNYYHQALKIYKELNNLAMVSQTLRNVAGILISQGLHEKALQTLSVASKLSSKLGDQEALKEIQDGQRRANRFIALSQRKRDFCNFPSSENNNNNNFASSPPMRTKARQRLMSIVPNVTSKGLESADAIELELLFEQGRELFDNEQYEDAILTYEAALQLAQKLRDRRQEAHAFQNLGSSYYCLENFGCLEAKVLDLYYKAATIYKELLDFAGLSMILRNCGMVFLNLANNRKAVHYFTQSIELSRKIGDVYGEQSALERLKRAKERLETVFES